MSMDEGNDGRKKAVSWYQRKCSDDKLENKSEDEDCTIVIRRKNSVRYNPMKSKSLEPKQEILSTTNTALSKPAVIEQGQPLDVFYLNCQSIDWSEGSLPRTQRRGEYRTGKLNTRLLEAVANGDTEEISRLLSIGANPNATCRLNHVSACHVASMVNNDSLSLLMKSGAENIRTDKLGRTPLHLAAWAGNPKQIAVLLRFPEELQNRVTLELTADIESEVRRISEVEHRLTNMPCNIGQLVSLPPTWTDSMEHNCRRIKENLPLFQPGWTALHAASARAQYTCVKLLLATGADPCAKDLTGRTPLDVVGAAHYTGHKIDVVSFRDVIKSILKAGGKFYNTHVNALNKVNTPLHTAVELESVDAIQELISAGASATCLNGDGLTAMHICVQKHLKEHLQILANYEYEDLDPYLATVDAKDVSGQTVLHAAVRSRWTDGVCIALGAGANIFAKAKDGESPIHSAAATGDIHILREILTVAKYAIDFRNQKGQTALFIAIIHNHIDIVEILIENGASLNVTLPDHQNVLHVVARYGYVEILEYLLTYGGRIIATLIDDLSGIDFFYTPLIYAVVNNHPVCVELLLWKGSKVDWMVPFQDELCNKIVSTTALHIAAAKNHFEIARIIIDFDTKTITRPNQAGLLPLHEACIHGNREIISLLVHRGADLARPGGHSKFKLTPIEMLMNNLSKPVAYMEEVFDSYISSQDMNLQDKECKVTVNYDILVPNPLDGRQMRVVKALVNTGNRYDQRKLLQHPLLESFLYLKWKALLPFFYCIIALYALFVLSLNVYVVSVFYYQDINKQNNIRNATERLTEGVNVKSVPCYLVSDAWKYMIYLTVSLIALQTWVKFGATGLSMFLPSVVSWRETEMETDYPSPEWARLIATIALLLSWLELMFLLSRIPSWGFYVLMFGKVATKVFKILLSFGFLILGFALCFMIQFRAKPPFEGPWAAVTKTLVMMTSEYDYMTMINSDIAGNIAASIPILQIIFITFMILASIVLMNLIVGVAVNNVSNLEQIGKQKRLEKQVDFLASLEDIVCHKVIRRILLKFNSTWYLRQRVKNFIVLRPQEATCTYNNILPTHIREAIFEKAQLQKKQMDDELGSMAYHMKLDEIHDAIVRQDDKIEQPDWQTHVAMLNKTVEKINKDIQGLHNEISIIKQLLIRRHSLY